MYYFGCFGPPGHYFFRPSRFGPIHADKLASHTVPWTPAECDGNLQPGTAEMKKGYQGQRPNKQVEGVCRLHSRNGWTAVAFWDRTGDERRNSCSVFIKDGEYDFHDMVSDFRLSFPEVYKRVTEKFELVEEPT
jgi:hypothetical protein